MHWEKLRVARGLLACLNVLSLVICAQPAEAAGTWAGRIAPSDGELRERLAVRLEAADAATSPAQAVTRTLAPGIVAVVVDLAPRQPVAVGPAQLSEWRRTSRRVFALATRNMRLRYRPASQPVELDDGVVMHVFSGNAFAAAHVLRIAEERVCRGREGALVIMPANDFLACYPINDSETERAVQMMSVVAYNAHREHAQPLSAQVFWLRRGRWMAVPYEMKDDGYDYIGTPEFDRMLARLPLLVDEAR
jgi:hypothetical protein